MSGEKIVIVEDESVEAWDLKEVLEDYGYEVPLILSGESDAVEKILEIKPELVLMDIFLQGKDFGINLASQIKQWDIPVIYLTGHAEHSTINNAMLTEPYAYIMKPYDQSQLQYIVKMAISKHKMEIQLKESENKYRALVEQAADALFVHDFDGNIIEVNNHACQSLGYSREELLQMNIMDIEQDYDLPSSQEIWSNIKLYDQFTINGHHKRKNNTIFPVEIKFAHVYIDANRDDKIVVMALARDVTIRMEAQKATMISEQHFRAIAETAIDGIVTTDDKGNIIFFNESFSKIFGYAVEELRNQHLTLLVPDYLKQHYLTGLETYKETNDHLFFGKIVQIEGLRKDNSIFPFEMSHAAWELEGKSYFTSIIRDVSQREETEKELKKSLKEKKLLIQEIHHRVKNNMQIISSMLHLQSVNANQEAVQVLNESQTRVKAMALIHQKLYQAHDLSTVDFADYITNLVLDLFYFYNIDGSRIQLLFDIDRDIRLNIETAIPCGLLINELVSNSLKHAFPGDRTGKVQVKLKRLDNQMFELVINDDGIGINDEDYAYSQSLGLQLVRSLTNQIEGKITLDTAHSTKFQIIFKELQYEKRLYSDSS